MSKGQAKPWFPSPKREPDPKPEPEDKAIGTAVEPDPSIYEPETVVLYHKFIAPRLGGGDSKCVLRVQDRDSSLRQCGFDESHAVHHRGETPVQLGYDTVWITEGDPLVNIDANGQEVGRIEAIPEVTVQRGGIQFPQPSGTSDPTTNITMTVETLHCSNVQCRIVTYRGGVILPFRHCPVCNTPGLVTSS